MSGTSSTVNGSDVSSKRTRRLPDRYRKGKTPQTRDRLHVGISVFAPCLTAVATAARSAGACAGKVGHTAFPFAGKSVARSRLTVSQS